MPMSSAAMSCTRPSRRAIHGSVGPWTRVNTTTRTNTRLKIRSEPATPAVTGIVATTMGTAPRKPAQDTKACSLHGSRNHTDDSTTDSGRAISSRTNPTPSAPGGRRRPIHGESPAIRASRTARSARAKRCPPRSRASQFHDRRLLPRTRPPGTSRGSRSGAVWSQLHMTPRPVRAPPAGRAGGGQRHPA